MFAAGIAAAVALAVWWGPAERSADPDSAAAQLRGTHAAPEGAQPHGAAAARAVDAALGQDQRAGSASTDAREVSAAARADTGEGTASGEAAPSEPAERTAAALLGDLRAMSEGYRNRVFLHAIRERGHHCEGVAGTQLGAADAVAWRVACHGGRAYLIHADAAGELAVDALYYTDPTAIRGAPVPDDAPLRGPRLPPDNR